MKCPHCHTSFFHGGRKNYIGNDAENDWGVLHDKCPECNKIIIWIISGNRNQVDNGPGSITTFPAAYLARPKMMSREPIGPEIPEDISADYYEACMVLDDSPKASAALSRRCLQHLLREHANVSPGNLADEIQQVIDSNQLPSHLAESIDAIRNLGNFAAHPIKSSNTGEILPVEPGESEWNLDVLESLFDFYFVQPAILKSKRAALNAKLVEANKPEMK